MKERPYRLTVHEKVLFKFLNEGEEDILVSRQELFRLRFYGIQYLLHILIGEECASLALRAVHKNYIVRNCFSIINGIPDYFFGFVFAY